MAPLGLKLPTPICAHGVNLNDGLHPLRLKSIFGHFSTARGCHYIAEIFRASHYCCIGAAARQGTSCKWHDESYDTFFHLISKSIRCAVLCLRPHTQSRHMEALSNVTILLGALIRIFLWIDFFRCFWPFITLNLSIKIIKHLFFSHFLCILYNNFFKKASVNKWR